MSDTKTSTLKAERLASGGSGMKCRCESPQIYLHRLDIEVRCSSCGKPPRLDLGGPDDVCRIRYRVHLNKITDEAARIQAERSAVPKRPGGRRFKTTRKQRVARAHLLREEGLTNTQIATEIGVTTRVIYSYFNDEDYEKQKARVKKYKGERKEHYRAYRREWYADNKEYWAEYRSAWRAKRRKKGLPV